MPKATLTDEEARGICRTPKPAPGSMKQVLDWANAHPSPEKIAPLLLLETENYATRKDLGPAVHEALARCAAAEQGPLWETVERDWDAYRVLHAIQVLGSLDGKETIERLIQLGKTTILRIHWKAIQNSAQAARITIPPDVVAAQLQLERQRGPGDFHDKYAARRENWPADHDQATGVTSSKSVAPARAAAFAKSAARKAPPGVSSVFLPDGETNEFLKKHKSKLSSGFTLTRMEGLFEEVDLGFYLTALDRNPEALEAVSFLAEHIDFGGNFNIWTPIGYAISLQSRLLRLSGKAAAAREALNRIQVHPFQVPPKASHLAQQIAAFPAELEKAFAEESTKWACQKLSRKLCPICYYVETGLAGFTHAGLYSAAELEILMADGLVKLRRRLGA
jgi:hypothetical protein